ncbi:sulfotransferase 1A3-like [Drosophila bipectinata]|uniref:sulfotransferase 1A3-like n=1 Tax=Drosophila bipectinata TaxID=42026 RepID=UPI0038B3AE18
MERVEFTPRSYPTNLIKKDWSERKHYHNKNIGPFLDLVHDMEMHDEDVFIVTLPKCGTTWMQELLWLVINNCNFTEALSKDLELRTPFLEFDYQIHGELDRAFKPVDDLKDPRLIKSHLPLALLPAKLWERKNKVIYVFRNPIDAYVSRYYHGVTFGHYYGKTLEEVFEKFIEKEESVINVMEHAHEFY